MTGIIKGNPQIWDELTGSICEYAAKVLINRKIKPHDVVIFDIDGTLIKDEKFCILPVKKLYEFALNQGYRIFIVTARVETLGNRIFTSIMLEKCGIDSYESLFMRPPEETDLFKYKTERRKTIFDMGFNSVMSVGDMPFDFGPYGGLSVKIPIL
jgi:phosphoglycolate phosphatase-like HAD superfamily hydrolase